MSMSSVVVYRNLHVKAMALYPFILLRNEEMKNDPVIMNHERIHHRQQLELLIIPFYVLYLINYLFNRMHFTNHREAYLNIVFEREAYAHDSQMNYLDERKWFAFVKFMGRKRKVRT